MKILQINVTYRAGSTGRIMYDIHNELIKSNFKSFVAFGRNDINEKNAVKIGTNLNLYLHVLGTRLFDKHGLYSKSATNEFIKKIDKLNIDIFHLHNIHGYYVNYPVLFEYLKNKKVVWTLHDCWAFTGHCAYYDFIGCNKWQLKCYDCPQKTSYPTSYVFDNSEKNFELKKKYFTMLENLTIVTPSKWLADETKKSFLSKYNIEVIYNGIDIEIFKPVKSDIRRKYGLEDKFIILGVANIWSKRKGFEYFLEIAKRLDDSYKLILIGLSEKQLQKLPSNIIGIKKTNNLNELVEFYSSADVFVNPTLEDNFPTVNLESLACGTPVITFKTGGSPESIDDNTGMTVNKGDVESLLKTIKQIRKNGKIMYKSHCVQRARNLFDKKKNYKKYIDLYNNL